MKETTFGNSSAAKTLAMMLAELNNPKVTTSVTRFLISQSTLAKTISSISDLSHRALIRKWAMCEAKAATLTGVTGKIETFMKNVAIAKFRQID